MIATTADLMEMILRTPEPAATRLKQAWLRLREDDRWIAGETKLPPVEVPATILDAAIIDAEQAKGTHGIRALKHQLAVTAKARYGKAEAGGLGSGCEQIYVLPLAKEGGIS